MDREIVKQIAYDVIKDYMVKHQKKVAPANVPDHKEKAKELLKKCDQNYQKNISDKLISND